MPDRWRRCTLASVAAMADDPEQLWHGALRVQIVDPRKEVPGAHDEDEHASSRHAFVSYGVRAETDLPHFARTYMVTRKRFQDFVFLHHALSADFPACIVPPLPGKHRIGYLTGDRFSAEFIARRCMELQLFMERICRHPVLQRAKIVQQFLESKEWHIDMHTHAGHPIASGGAAGDASALTQTGTTGLLESMSDMFVNAFTHVRKPDARFVAIRADLEGEEDRATQWERVLLRHRMHRSGTSWVRSSRPYLCCKTSMTHAGVKWPLLTSCTRHSWAHRMKT